LCVEAAALAEPEPPAESEPPAEPEPSAEPESPAEPEAAAPAAVLVPFELEWCTGFVDAAPRVVVPSASALGEPELPVIVDVLAPWLVVL
jgi:hypothetical protein